MLYDNHGRIINYVRLAVTDRCNLRCFYCMPEEGIAFAPKSQILSYEEMVRVITVLSEMGISKVRLTGGEPFVRRDIMQLIESIAALKGIKKIALTTNGTLTTPYIKDFKKNKLTSVNLSLDSLDAKRFFEVTRRDEYHKVMETLDELLKHDIDTKINCVVMQGKNEQDILPLVEMARHAPLSIRFIEEMPFNGTGQHPKDWIWSHKKIIEHIKEAHPSLEKIPDEPNSTSFNYKIDGFQGSVGVIAAYTRSFCGSCNRIRLTPQGLLKTCLYDSGIFNVRDMMRNGATDGDVKIAFLEAIGNRAKNGFEAEAQRFMGTSVFESMTTIGG
jgi:molybdenum cofactor biosynthesis protein A